MLDRATVHLRSSKGGLHLAGVEDPNYRVPAVNQAHALSASAAGQTVPLWRGSAVAFGNRYDYTIVGQSPFASGANPSATIGVDIVPVKLEFLDPSNRVVETFDPAAANADCGLNSSPTELVPGSPLFQPASYHAGGTTIGTGQYLDVFMREQFASQALGPNAPNPGYGLTLKPTTRPEVTITVPAADWRLVKAAQTGACGRRPGGDLGVIDMAAWDNYLHQKLIPQLQSTHATTPTDMLNFMIANVILCYPPAGTNITDWNACGQGHNLALGYHLGTSTPAGVQYYDTADYDSTGLTGGPDIEPMSHELAEWLDDPNGDNPTPPWGDLGQVHAGCQNNLEVGDPFQTSITVTMPNGSSYHPTELAFLSWFYRAKPSAGVNGWYSSNGSFTSVQPLCAGPAGAAQVPPRPGGHSPPLGP